MATVDAVYPLGTGSRLFNIEIVYSLRSLVKNTRGLGRIYVIGEKPDCLNWSDDLIHVPFEEKHGAYVNTWEKAMFAASIPGLTERFIWMNDDFYCVEPFDADSIPGYTRAATLDKCDFARKTFGDIHQHYSQMLRLTLDALRRRGLTTHHFATHQPCNFEKSLLLKTHEEFKGDLYTAWGLDLRCCYGNLNAVPPVGRWTTVIRNTPVDISKKFAFATHRRTDRPFAEEFLGRLYPTLTKYEAGVTI